MAQTFQTTGEDPTSAVLAGLFCAACLAFLAAAFVAVALVPRYRFRINWRHGLRRQATSEDPVITPGGALAVAAFALGWSVFWALRPVNPADAGVLARTLWQFFVAIPLVDIGWRMLFGEAAVPEEAAPGNTVASQRDRYGLPLILAVTSILYGGVIVVASLQAAYTAGLLPWGECFVGAGIVGLLWVGWHLIRR